MWVLTQTALNKDRIQVKDKVIIERKIKKFNYSSQHCLLQSIQENKLFMREPSQNKKNKIK